MAEPTAGAQDTLPGLRATVRAARQRPVAGPEPDAAIDPVARVLVDVSLAHLDRDFDYRVPASMADAAQPGARVTVRFAGQKLPGFVLSRHQRSEHDGRLAPLRSVVSPEPVLRPEIAELATRIAERYAGTRGDVLRLAVPPRHARVEREDVAPAVDVPPTWDGDAAASAWQDYPAGPAFVHHLAAGQTPRAVWTAAPGADWPLLARPRGRRHPGLRSRHHRVRPRRPRRRPSERGAGQLDG